MTMRKIFVSGEGVRAAITGALVTRLCAGPDCEVHIISDPVRLAPRVVMRPDVYRYHGEIGLEPQSLANLPNVTAVFAVAAPTPNGTVQIPYAGFGEPLLGVEFHHLLSRAKHFEAQPDLQEFSPSIVLQRDAPNLDLAQASQLPIPFGIAVPCADYVNMLLSHAQNFGGKISARPNLSVDRADLVIDCSPLYNATGWEGGTVSIGLRDSLDGIEWQHLYNNVKRAVDLAAGSSEQMESQREFNRLAAAEHERILDFEELFKLADPQASDRSALRRKIEVFEACGRIPMEDYEVFGQPEWLAAFWGTGLRPKRYNRMADAFSQAEITDWIARVQRQIAQLAATGASK